MLPWPMIVNYTSYFYSDSVSFSAELAATKSIHSIKRRQKMADTYERVILAKPDVFVYQIPPRGSTTRAVRCVIRKTAFLLCHKPFHCIGRPFNINRTVIKRRVMQLLLLSFRAADWQLTEPNWKGRMRIVVKGNVCWVRLEDRISGES